MNLSNPTSTLARCGGVIGKQITPILANLNVTVPVGFLGNTFGRTTYDPTYTIPTGVNAGKPFPSLPAVTWNYGWVRSHDAAPNWRSLHTASNTFSAAQLAILDAYVNYFYSLGKKVIYTIFGTPQWAAATTPNFTDQYGQLYGANPPSDLGTTGSAYLAQFVSMLVNRYNTGGMHKLAAIEIWNEPKYDTTASSYFTGTGAQLSQIAKTVYQTAKAIDPSITILSPSFIGGASYMTTYLTGAVGDGTFGSAYQDAMAYHGYDFSVSAGFYTADVVELEIKHNIGDYKTAMTSAGVGSLPLYDTECGWLNDWPNFSVTKRAQLIKSSGLIHAAMGVKAQIYYLADNYYNNDGTVNTNYAADVGNTGNLYGGPLATPEIAAALSWVNNLGGKRITEIGYYSGGGLYANTDSGLMVTS